MNLEILCTTRLSKDEKAELDRIAAIRHTTRENLVREAVRIFSAKCVPTQDKAAARGK